MVTCVLCGKQRAEFEMRPLVNLDELKVGNALAEPDKAAGVESEREVGGSKLQIVCRSCWHAILESKDKAAVIEMMETLCGLLFEVDRRAREALPKVVHIPLSRGHADEIIEKWHHSRGPVWRGPTPRRFPATVGPVYVGDPPLESQRWTVGPGRVGMGTATNITISQSAMASLADALSDGFAGQPSP